MNKSLKLSFIALSFVISSLASAQVLTPSSSEDDAAYSAIAKNTANNIDDLLSPSGSYILESEGNHLLIINPKLSQEEAEKIEKALKVILNGDFEARRIYERTGVTDPEAYKQRLLKDYMSLKKHGLNGKRTPYPGSIEPSSDISLSPKIHCDDFLLERYLASNIPDQDATLPTTHQRQVIEYAEFQTEQYLLYNIALIDALMDVDSFSKKMLDMISSYFYSSNLKPVELSVFSELIMSRDISLEDTRAAVALCHDLLNSLNRRMREDEGRSFREKFSDGVTRYTYAVVDLFRKGYWKLPEKYKVDTELCTNIIASASYGYGIDGLDFENKKDWTYFQELQDKMAELSMDFTDQKSIKWLESIREDYYQNYYQPGLPELFQDYSYNPSMSSKHNETTNAGYSSRVFANNTHPSLTKRSNYKAIQILKELSSRDGMPSSLISYLAMMPELDIVDYLMELSYYDPNICQPSSLCVIDLDRGKRLQVERQQEMAVTSLAIMYSMIDREFNPVVHQYIGNFLKTNTKSSNRSVANVSSLALGLSQPYPNHQLKQSINSAITLVKDFGLITAVPSLSPAALNISKFGSMNKGSAVNKTYKGSRLFTVETGRTMNISIPAPSILLNPVGSSASIPFVTNSVWSIPKVVVNSERLMESIFLLTRIAGAGAVVQSNLGTFFVNPSNSEILTEHDTKAFHVEAIKQSPLYLEVSYGNELLYQYVIALTGPEHLEAIKQHISLISTINPDISISILTEYQEQVTPHASTALPESVILGISELLRSSDVPPTLESDIIAAFKNGLSFSAPKVSSSFMGDNTIETVISVRNQTDGSLSLEVSRTLAGSSGLMNYVRTFNRFADGVIKEEAKVLDLAKSNASSESIVLNAEEVAAMEKSLAMYKNFCGNLRPI